ncbi:MAG: thioesterase family protein [Streptosporangiales bacterium]|nr:thioesterase family protein [Streptosporangiales bacterium]
MEQTTHQALRPALLAGLDGLLAVLEPERAGDHRFRFAPDPDRWPDRVFGGQLLAQAIVAASATTPGKVPLSVHAAFVRAGTPGQAVEAVVDPVRDGRTFATRQVTLLENGRTVLTAIVTGHAGGEPEGDAVPDDGSVPLPSPDDTPSIQDWARRLPGDVAGYGRHWIERPPAVEIRMAEAPCFLDGPPPGRARSHWMRAPRDLGPDPVRNAAVLAYASDFLLMDMVFHAHPAAGGAGGCNGLSLDHAIWFHRPVTFGQWHRHAQEAAVITGPRGLVRGTVHDAGGRLAATVAQEVLVLPAGTR